MNSGPLKRYLAFAGDTYYPAGGWDDLVGDYDTIEDAQRAISAHKHDWFEIIDCTTGEKAVP